jgi:tyrosine decarboxylase / aspartate 1-decarboxylase
LHLGEISLECSRAGAAAVALWATQKLLPLKPGGEFANGLAAGRRAAVGLDRRLRADGRFEARAAGAPELDIVVWRMKRTTRSFGLEESIFSACAKRNLHLALVQLPQFWFGCADSSSAVEEHVTCLRSVLMKPEHEEWLDRIWNELSTACAEVEEG